MSSHARHPLAIVGAFLVTITVVSWLISRDGGAAHQINAAVTVGVLLIAAVKAQLVIRYFMEVRHAPIWLKRTMNAWLVLLFTLLLGFYFASL